MVQTILVVDDEASQRAMISHVLSKKLDYHVIELSGGKDAIDYVMSSHQPVVDLMLLDLSMPGIDGIEVIKRLREAGRQFPIVVLSMYGSLEKAVEAVRAGADDFLAKPVTLARLQMMLHTQLKMHGLISQLRRHEIHARREAGFSEVMYRSDTMRRVVEQAKAWADLKEPILIAGEAGTGKTLLACAMADACGSASDHCHAVMLGASDWRAELRAAIEKCAPGDTLMVDLPPILLEQKDWYFLSREMADEARNQDVFLRYMRRMPRVDLGHGAPMPFMIEIPALRKRKDDIAVLAAMFLQRFASMERCNADRFHTEALEWMQQQGWPGNVRELAHAIYRAVIVSDHSVLQRDDLCFLRVDSQRRGAPNMQVSLLDEQGKLRPLQSIEDEAIMYALGFYNGCLSKTARALRIGRTTLYRKLNQLGFNRYEFKTKQDEPMPSRQIYS